MTAVKNKYFHIKFGDKEYTVLTKRMLSDQLLGDISKATKFLIESGSGIWVAHDKLYAVLLQMTMEYQKEEMTIKET